VNVAIVVNFFCELIMRSECLSYSTGQKNLVNLRFTWRE